ncbi:DNA-processing protein DprA [Shimia marina]|uniref:DNA protecting protein DprA n=1 Tax=Shimia marina TaxID=321267 RepID=A0A0P1FDT4_9RHOB|nr:DNA-processing protein DprA [Shimia marina]CUH52856.1 DNA protecting protein DprA [Shimia marina]SFD88975.1 DNA protecting protein DprA [Shimia marina]
MTEDRISSTHPQIPPTTEEARLLRLRLLRSRRVGAITYHRLIREHGTAEAALDALPDIARAAGVSRYTICPQDIAAKELEDGRATGARPIFFGDPEYPMLLAQTPDAPPMLWALGRTELLATPSVAVIGARNASSLGLRMAGRLASDLGAAGLTVVSGLARGIDAAAHEATLATGTIAVYAGGLRRPYPAQNLSLAENIAKQGLCLSEQPPNMEPRARHFPARNRIISGLVRAVIVVEAAAKSGSLLTARMALDQGRDVLAVPGHPFDARAAGANILIRDGAPLVRDAEDVLEVLNAAQALRPAMPDPSPERATSRSEAQQPATARSLQDTAALHSEILNRLGPSPLSEDQLCRDLATVPAKLTPALLDLEMSGAITRMSGGLLSKN